MENDPILRVKKNMFLSGEAVQILKPLPVLRKCLLLLLAKCTFQKSRYTQASYVTPVRTNGLRFLPHLPIAGVLYSEAVSYQGSIDLQVLSPN